MDEKGSEWNAEQIVVRMWVGYIWNGLGCLVLPWLQNINMVLALITAISHVYVSNIKLNIYQVLLICV